MRALRQTGGGIGGVVLGLLLAPAPARAAVTLELSSLLAVEKPSGWRLVAELEGSSEVTSATLTPPGRPAVALACETSAGLTECEFESDEAASLAELLVDFPAGTWLLSLNGGTRTASLAFAPVAPNGAVTVTSPADGATGVSSTPTLAWTHDCSNCIAILLEIEDLAGPFAVGLEATVFGAPPPSPGTLSYDSLESYQGPRPEELPNGTYALTAEAAVGSIEEETLSPGGAPFEYATGALRVSETTFTVPEPGPLASGGAAAAALAAGRRRRRARAQRPAATSPSSISIQPSRA